MLVVAVAVLAFMPSPPEDLSTGWDKANHVLAFATLALVGGIGFRGVRAAAAKVAAGLVGFGALIEVVQYFVPGRSSEWKDLLADAIGIAVGTLVCLALLAARRRRAGPARPGDAC